MYAYFTSFDPSTGVNTAAKHCYAKVISLVQSLQGWKTLQSILPGLFTLLLTMRSPKLQVLWSLLSTKVQCESCASFHGSPSKSNWIHESQKTLGSLWNPWPCRRLHQFAASQCWQSPAEFCFQHAEQLLKT